MINILYCRIPGAGDQAHIQFPGSYTVLIDKDVTIHSLVIGSGSSSIGLNIDTAVTVNITGSLEILCPHATVLGKLVVNTLQWSGQYLDGSSAIGSSTNKGQVIVFTLFLVKQGLYNQKYLRDIIITNENNFTVDVSMDSYSRYLDCQYCQVLNKKNATFLINGVQLYLNGRPSQSDSDGFGAGIINEGLVIITSANSYLYKYWYWDLRNTGTVKVLSGYYQSSSYVRFYGRIINNGLIQSFMTYVYFESSVWIQPSSGSWEIYGYPYRSSNAPTPVGQRQQWQWNEFLRDVYQNISADLWNPDNTITVYFRYFYSENKLHFNNLTTFGHVLFQTYYVRSTAIHFAQGLHLGSLGEMQLQQYSSSSTNDNNRLVVGEAGWGDFDANLVTVGGGWTVEIGSGSAVETYRRLVIEEGGKFIVQPGAKNVQLMKFVGIKSTGILSISGRKNSSINGDIYVRGTLNISNSTMGVTGEIRFTQGAITGQSSQLHIYKLGSIRGNFGKTIDGVEIHIRRLLLAPNSAIVEYFQYRVDTDLTSRLNGINNFPGSGSSSYSLPPEFNDPATEPNTAQLVEGLDRKNEYYGSSPIAVTSTFGWFDTNSPDSFTYLYAARMWTFLQIDQKGSYTFFIDSGYGMRVRLWINDVVVFTGSQWLYLVSYKEKAGPYSLNTGLNRIRIDFIQERSYWSSQNALLVTYSGPSFSERPLPQDKMFGMRTFANGTVKYANPKFNATKFLPAKSILKVGGQGLLLAKNGASVMVDKTGILEVTDDIIWFSHTLLGSKSKIVNSGQVIKTGDDGVATFYADYISKGGSLISYYGLLEFKDARRDGGLAFWNNPAGGNWFDANNWFPAKVPGPTDVVHITLEGTYLVIVPGHSNVSVLSLTLGFASSFPELVVGHYGQLTVLDRLDMYARVTTINGIVTTQYLTWTGERIRGSTFAGEIIVQGSFAMIKGAYNSKYLSNVNITVWKSLSIDSSLNSENNYWYCDNCFVINEATSTMLANKMRWSISGYGPAQSDGFRVGLVNYGLLVYEVDYCCGIYIYWDIRNYGEIKIITKQYQSTYSIYMYGTWINYNLTQIYSTNFYFYNSRPLPEASNGTWIVYGQPVRYQSAPAPVGQNRPGTWKEYLADLYQNASDPTTALWNPGNRVSIYLHYAYFSASSPGVYSFNKFISYGAIDINTYYCRYTILQFNQGLYMGKQGKLNLQPYSSSDSSWNAIEVGNNTELTVGQALVQTGWNVTVGQGSNATFYQYVTIYERGRLTFHKGSRVIFHDNLVGRTTSLLDFSGSVVTCHSNLSAHGTLEIGRGTLSVHGRWSLSEGQVTGLGGTIYPYGGWNITSDYDKTLAGININIALPTDRSATKNGIIADYFQYRVDTDRTSRLYGLYYFPGSGSSSYSLPSYFDNSSSAPNAERIEATLQRFPQQYGTGPLYILPDGGNPDTSDPRSFTYHYAARLWTFLKIDVAGNYTFYFVPGYSLSLRLWIDDQLREAGTPQWSSFPSLVTSGPYNLAVGYRKLRIDYLVESSYWSTTGCTLLVYYSGPGINKQLIPSSKLFYHDGTKYVKTSYKPVTTNTAWLSGEGLLLAQNAVNVSICSKCEFQVLEDVLWYSDRSLGGVTTFINSGILVRQGLPGTAAIYGKYVGKAGSSQKTVIGLLEFRDAGTVGGLAIWTNPNGGSWTDPHNWSPKRVPRPGDVVHITLAGTYQVIIPSYTVVNVTSISVGSSRSLAELVIQRSSKVYVSDRIGVHSPRLTMNGLLRTSKMTWTGQYLVGSQTFLGKLIIDLSIVVVKGSYSTKYLQYVTVENRANFTLDSSFGSDSNYLYCTNCLIYNYGILLLSSARFHQNFSSSSQRGDGFRYGIVNYGEAIAELQTAPSYGYYLYYQWDVLNYGNWSVICKKMGGSCYFNLYGVIANYGKLQFYMTDVYIDDSGNPVQLAKTNGTWELFGKPYRDNNLNQAPGSGTQGDWQAYLDNVYKNISLGLWDLDSQYTLYLQYLYNNKLYFNDLRTYGRVILQAYQVRQTHLYFDTRLDLGPNSDLSLQKYSSAIDNNLVVCGSQAKVVLRQVNVGQGWSIGIGESGSLTAYGRVVINGGASLNASRGSSLILKESVVSILGSQLNLVGSYVSVKDWTHKGAASLDSSTIEVSGKLQWEQGSFSATGQSLLKIQHYCKISGSFLKTLSGLDISIESPKQGEVMGIVAEYFQYRVATSTTNQLNGIYYFPGQSSSTSYTPPSNFDLASTKANVMRIESSLQRLPQYYGTAPIAYQTGSVNYDSTSSHSFTYRYAARLWSYLKIDRLGSYTFYFKTAYAMRVRVWLDGKQYLTTRQWLYLSNEEKSSPIILQAGYRLLRIDYIQDSSYWNTRGGAMLVSYEGPGVSKQKIPDDRLFAVRMINGQPTAAASNLKFLSDSKVCKSSLSLGKLISDYGSSVGYCVIEGKGVLVTSDGVNITVGQSGVLDLKTDTDWPKAPNHRTQLRVEGMVTKSLGSGLINLNTEYDFVSATGCLKSFSGKLELGIKKGSVFVGCKVPVMLLS